MSASAAAAAAAAAPLPPATADGELLLLHCYLLARCRSRQPVRFALLPDDELSSCSPKPTIQRTRSNNLTSAVGSLASSTRAVARASTRQLVRASTRRKHSSSCKAFRTFSRRRSRGHEDGSVGQGSEAHRAGHGENWRAGSPYVRPLRRAKPLGSRAHPVAIIRLRGVAGCACLPRSRSFVAGRFASPARARQAQVSGCGAMMLWNSPVRARNADEHRSTRAASRIGASAGRRRRPGRGHGPVRWMASA